MNAAAVMGFDLKCMSLESDQKRTINPKNRRNGGFMFVIVILPDLE
jgi:hypothetical protein